ncbi:MAG: hypothetical protein ACKVOQ_14735 [Cyclobacteriaceae bacterium]|jgi:hypothetical protein
MAMRGAMATGLSAASPATHKPAHFGLSAPIPCRGASLFIIASLNSFITRYP